MTPHLHVLGRQCRVKDHELRQPAGKGACGVAVLQWVGRQAGWLLDELKMSSKRGRVHVGLPLREVMRATWEAFASLRRMACLQPMPIP